MHINDTILGNIDELSEGDNMAEQELKKQYTISFGDKNKNTVNNSYLDQMYLGTGSLVEWSDYISAYYYNLFQYNDDRMFFYDVDTSGGNSGGPIYVTKHVYDKNGNNHQVYYDVIGICTAEFTEYGIGVVNMGMRMNGELLRFYLDNNNINW